MNVGHTGMMTSEHSHPMEPRWALDGGYGRRFHLAWWEPYHGAVLKRAVCGVLPGNIWHVVDPSRQQESERCKRCLRWAAKQEMAT